MLSKRHRSRIYDYYLRKSGGLKLSEEIVELNGDKRNCRLKVEIVVETRRSNLTIRKQSYLVPRNRISDSKLHKVQRISGADMNIVE